MSKKLSTAFLVLAGALWGCLSIFVSALSDYGFDSKEIGFIRISLCTLMLLVIILIRDRSLLRVQLRDMWMFVGTGIISVTLFSYCYFTTVINVEAGIAASLLYTSPIFVMLFSAVLFRERITAQKIAAIVLTVSGVALVSGMLGSSALGALDLIIGIGAGLFYSLRLRAAQIQLAHRNILHLSARNDRFSVHDKSDRHYRKNSIEPGRYSHGDRSCAV